MANTEPTPIRKHRERLNLVLVDDERIILKMLYNHISQTSVFNVSTFDTICEACLFLENSTSIHICITDLYMGIGNTSETYLLNRFSKRIPLIVHTARESGKLGFTCGELGAVGYVEKKIPFSPNELIATAFRLALRARLFGKFTNPEKDETIKRYADALFEQRPSSIGEWAGFVGVTDTQLRKLCIERCGLKPKNIQTLFRAYIDRFLVQNMEYSHNDILLSRSALMREDSFRQSGRGGIYTASNAG